MIVETILSSDEFLRKNAGESVIHSLTQSIKDYIDQHIDPEHPAESYLSLFAPGVISMTLRAFGHGWLGMLFGMAASVFQIDIKNILSSIHDKLKEEVSDDKPTSSSRVSEIVEESVKEHDKPITEDTIKHFSELTTEQQLIHAKLIKLALIMYREELYDSSYNNIYKWADLKSALNTRKGRTVSVLAKVLTWIFTVSLAAAGLIVGGDMVNKFIGRPSAIDKTLQHGKPIASLPSELKSTPVTQTKFKINPNYHEELVNVTDNWIERTPNTPAGITAMLLNFAKQVYPSLSGLENVIQSTDKFQTLVSDILWYNHSAAGDPIVFIPKTFTSKKKLVDYFIDEVAQKTP